MSNTKPIRAFGLASSLSLVLSCAAVLHAQPTAAAKILFDQDPATLRIKPSSPQVTTEIGRDAAAPGMIVTIETGSDGYPGIELTAKDGRPWDLSQFGHVEVKVANLGAKSLGVHLRLDNDADWQLSPFNSESVYLDPGKSGTVAVIFGYAYGRKPSYPLKASAVSRMLLFTGKAGDVQKFRIESIRAAGPPGEKPPVDPALIRVQPVKDFLAGGGVPLDFAKQINVTEGAEATPGADGKTVRIAFSKATQNVTIKPVQGAWDLRGGHQVRVVVKNVGATAVTPAIRVTSAPGATDKAAAPTTIEPGQFSEIIASFIPAAPWTGIKDANKNEWNPTEGTGTKFISDAATGVVVSLLPGAEAKSEGQIEVQSISLAAPQVDVPEWLGRRPPVDGEWIPTFQEEFDGDAINLSKWNVYTANYWDKLSHFSKDNVIVANGNAVLRYEKKTGRHNDDPQGKETKYASGFIDTCGKWVQRYGYFEARMKLPKAPGLWPAMWLMPDRGLAEGEQGRRADTGHSGMEFDIMEFLSRWGSYRYNIAFHWDGYGDKHKQTGTTTIYADHDRSGYITTGLLWLPGRAAIFNNGRLVAKWESSRISSVPSDLMFTHVMGGWDNDDLDDAQLPDEFVIDYVRCWQRKDLASDADGVKSTQSTPAAPTKPD